MNLFNKILIIFFLSFLFSNDFIPDDGSSVILKKDKKEYIYYQIEKGNLSYTNLREEYSEEDDREEGVEKDDEINDTGVSDDESRSSDSANKNLEGEENVESVEQERDESYFSKFNLILKLIKSLF